MNAIEHVSSISGDGCPHCRMGFRNQLKGGNIDTDGFHRWSYASTICTSCHNIIIAIHGKPVAPNQRYLKNGSEIVEELMMAYPKNSNRPKPPEIVDDEYTEDYTEACIVLPYSAKASAALTRRCLQNIIENKLGIKKRDLFSEIEEVIQQKLFHSYVLDQLHQVREIGNFAAHPKKSTNTGEIIAVEPGEAEWLLDTIESLFDVCFVEPEKLEIRKKAINDKVNEAKNNPK